MLSFMDADDKIGHEYMEKAVKILDKDSEIGIVYSRAEVFGSEQSEWNLPDYSPERILLENMIFASGFFRKKDWERVGGYRSVMKYGCEDWDFWLSLIEIKKKVYRIPEVLFYYRVRKDSMVRLIAKETIPVIYEQLIENHRTLYTDNVKAIFGSYRDMREEVFRLSEKCMAGKNTVEEKNIIIENQKNLIAQLLEKEKALESIYNSYGWRIYCASISTLPVSYILNLIKKVRAHHILLKCDRVELFYDSIEISGWALTGIERVEIYLDNMLLDKAVYGLPRPDVEKVYPFLKDSGTAGFYFSSKLPILCPLGNNHIIKIKGITYEGRKREIITSVISKGIVKPVISLTDIELYSGSLEISGWVVSDYGIDRVEIYLNNSLIACPDTNRTSSEGARLYPFVKNSDKSGFFLFALLYKEKAVEYNVLVKAIGLNGERTEMKHTVTVKDSQLLLTNGKTDCYTEPVRAKSDIKETLEIPVSNGFDVLSKSKELREDIQK
ncbi:MAG TPA: hypothetical protein PL110_21310, partial [Candidatus Eremiobacteraeota bacterium]|nr:hypothetical protein [Candidatus Eremiobacteraeota bacterium]